MAKTRPPKIPEKPVPVLPDDDVRRLLADCSAKDFRDRRDLAIIRLFLDTGMRLEGMTGLRYSADDPEASDIDLRSRVVRITAKGRRELVLPIGAKSARDIDRYIRLRAAHPRTADAWLWLGAKGRLNFRAPALLIDHCPQAALQSSRIGDWEGPAVELWYLVTIRMRTLPGATDVDDGPPCDAGLPTQAAVRRIGDA
jgi:site-specific recombinase XerD